MTLRRLIFASLLAATAAGLTGLLMRVLAAGGWTPLEWLILLCFLGVAPWLGVCVGNALPGFLLLFARRPARAVLPVAGDVDLGPVTARTALAVTVRNEDMAAVLAPLGRLLDGLKAAGVADRFEAFVLSDTAE